MYFPRPQEKWEDALSAFYQPSSKEKKQTGLAELRAGIEEHKNLESIFLLLSFDLSCEKNMVVEKGYTETPWDSKRKLREEGWYDETSGF